jgi:hypothetical protein
MQPLIIRQESWSLKSGITLHVPPAIDRLRLCASAPARPVDVPGVVAVAPIAKEFGVSVTAVAAVL